MRTHDDLDELLNEGRVYAASYASRDEFFSDVSQRLMDAGIVSPGFEDALAEREREYPTGLSLPAGDICLPHTDPRYVNRDGVVVVSFASPVEFRAMDDPSRVVWARAAFLLHMTDSKRHLAFLQRVVRSIQTPDLFERIEGRLEAVNQGSGRGI